MKSLSLNELEKLKNTNIDEIDIKELDNIDDIEIKTDKTPEEKIKEFLQKTKNPYYFNIDGYIVKFSFSNNDIEASKVAENSIKQIIYKKSNV